MRVEKSGVKIGVVQSKGELGGGGRYTKDEGELSIKQLNGGTGII